MSQTRNILRIDASARKTGSVSRQLTADVISRLQSFGDYEVTVRDLADGLPLLSENWIGANFTPADSRSDEQKDMLSVSDTIVREVLNADVLVIGLPIYNFSVPAALKAWIDLVARVGLTFKYTEKGPQGLLSGKSAILAVASGGTKVGSDIDFATGYMRHVLGFIGITDVQIIAADQLSMNAEDKFASAKAEIELLAA